MYIIIAKLKVGEMIIILGITKSVSLRRQVNGSNKKRIQIAKIG